MNPRNPDRGSTVFKTAALNPSAIPPVLERQYNTGPARSQKILKRIQEFRILELRIREL